jgi:hypothetical protein
LIILILLARRKGRSVALYVILALIPGANVLSALWLASQTDASIKAEIAELKARLDGQPPRIPPL